MGAAPVAWGGALFALLLVAGRNDRLLLELVVPFFMFLPRPFRLFAAWTTIAWQLLIIATSNHNWLNLLTILLCLFLFDDRALAKLLPSTWVRRIADVSPLPLSQRPTRRPKMAALTALVALVLVSAGLVTTAEMIAGRPFGAVSRWNEHIEPFRIANRYHVFPVIETERIVLGIEASLDGQTWVPLDFRYVPDATNQAPRFIVPHQPRVDWMLWFVPMNPLFLDWFDRFLQRLLDGSPAVTALLTRPPVNDGPPQQLRVRVYRYRFTNPTQRGNSGDWWTREDLGPFYPLPFAERPHGG